MASASAGPRALSARGQSDSWTKKKQGVLRIFERFRNSSPEITELYPVGIASLDERTLTTMKGGIYEHFAQYIANDYIIEKGNKNAGKRLSYSVAADSFSTIINIAHERFEDSELPSTKAFFGCLAPSGARTASGRWLLGMKVQIKRILHQEAMKAGDVIDQSATPLYEADVRFLSRAYSLDRRPTEAGENAGRMLAIATAWQCSGRSGELAYMDMESMRYDAHYQCVDFPLMQGKVRSVLACAHTSPPPRRTRARARGGLVGPFRGVSGLDGSDENGPALLSRRAALLSRRSICCAHVMHLRSSRGGGGGGGARAHLVSSPPSQPFPLFDRSPARATRHAATLGGGALLASRRDLGGRVLLAPARSLVALDAPRSLVAHTLIQVGKVKQVALVAGVDEELCWFTAFGQALALDPSRVKYNPDSETWMFPEIHRVKQPGPKLGGYVSDLLPRALGGAAGYQHVADKEGRQLPSDASAAGFRAGAVNTLVSRCCLESAVHFTGHDMSSTSAFFDYVDSSLSACMPGAIVIAGYPALPWGQNSVGPRPASLGALTGSTDAGALNRMLDKVLRLDSGAMPMFMSKSAECTERGKLRPIAEHAFARCAAHAHSCRTHAVAHDD